jgi:hypothetical protein
MCLEMMGEGVPPPARPPLVPPMDEPAETYSLETNPVCCRSNKTTMQEIDDLRLD